MASDGWEEVTDPRELQKVQKRLLPQAPPSGKVTPQDRVAMRSYRDLGDQADSLSRFGKNFLTRSDRFQTSAGKSLMFDAMYPGGEGLTGALKKGAGALLRGTVGYLYPQRDHDDYQYLTANAQALNNAALRLNKGTQTEGDAERIAKENVGVDKSPQTNRRIFTDNTRAAMAIAQARQQSASQWIAKYGGLTGTTNAQGMTYDDYFSRVVRPNAIKQSTGPKPRAKGGWSISRD